MVEKSACFLGLVDLKIFIQDFQNDIFWATLSLNPAQITNGIGPPHQVLIPLVIFFSCPEFLSKKERPQGIAKRPPG